MADERWKRLAEQQGVAYAKTVAQAMKLNLDMDNPADREKLRRAVLDLETALTDIVDSGLNKAPVSGERTSG
jgi:hypothetical protein